MGILILGFIECLGRLSQEFGPRARHGILTAIRRSALVLITFIVDSDSEIILKTSHDLDPGPDYVGCLLRYTQFTLLSVN